IYRMQGKEAEGEQHLRQALDVLRQAVGEKHPVYLAARNALNAPAPRGPSGGGKSGGAASGSDPRTEYSVPSTQYSSPGPQSGSTSQPPDMTNAEQEIQRLNTQVKQLLDQGHYDQAFSLGTQALEQARRRLGERHASYATSLNNLSWTHRARGNYKDA